MEKNYTNDIHYTCVWFFHKCMNWLFFYHFLWWQNSSLSFLSICLIVKSFSNHFSSFSLSFFFIFIIFNLFEFSLKYIFRLYIIDLIIFLFFCSKYINIVFDHILIFVMKYDYLCWAYVAWSALDPLWITTHFSFHIFLSQNKNSELCTIFLPFNRMPNKMK